MTAQTKFNVGDTTYTIDRDLKLISFVIESIYISVRRDATNITLYPESNSFDLTGYPEAHCFRSKDELFNYIQSIEK